MCNTLLVSKHGYFSSFLFRARQACNQMQFIYRNDTTSTDHDKVSSLVWDKTPFMVSVKGWIKSMSLWGVSVRVGSFRFITSGEKLTQLEALIKRANVDLDCWGQTAYSMLWRNFTIGQIKIFILCSSKTNATSSPVIYVHMQLLHNWLVGPDQTERFWAAWSSFLWLFSMRVKRFARYFCVAERLTFLQVRPEHLEFKKLQLRAEKHPMIFYILLIV